MQTQIFEVLKQVTLMSKADMMGLSKKLGSMKNWGVQETRRVVSNYSAVANC